MTNPVESIKRPVVGVGAVILRGDEIALIRRGNPPKVGEWSLPGGRVELGETTANAVIREVEEETGLKVTLGPLIDTVDFIETDDTQVNFHYVLVDYIAYYLSGEIKAGSDAADARFFSLDDALSLPLWSETKRIIKAARNLAQENPE